MVVTYIGIFLIPRLVEAARQRFLRMDRLLQKGQALGPFIAEFDSWESKSRNGLFYENDLERFVQALDEKAEKRDPFFETSGEDGKLIRAKIRALLRKSRYNYAY